MEKQSHNSDIPNLIEQLSNRERKIIKQIRSGMHVSRNTNIDFDAALTFGDRISDRLAKFGGSWPFIIIFLGVLAGWILINSVIMPLIGKSFDPYPYIFLNLVLSMLAAIQAPIILMSQNRQTERDRLDAAHDFEVNLKAEIEINELREKLDQLSAEKIEKLISIQEQQLSMLTNIRAILNLYQEKGNS